MSSAANEQQFIIGKLVPFLISTTIYFVLLVPYESPSVFAVIIKCSPIVCLMYFVVRVGFSKGLTYSGKIMAGLICCCIGDAFLLWNKYFVYGMLAFATGHLNYIWAFGFKPLKLKLGILIFLLGGIGVSFFLKGLSGVLLIGVPIYILVISIMVWRAMARIQNPWTWIQLSTCMGSILFAASDFIIGLDKFVQPIAHSQVLIMSSYYAAQLGISLSVLEAIQTSKGCNMY